MINQPFLVRPGGRMRGARHAGRRAVRQDGRCRQVPSERDVRAVPAFRPHRRDGQWPGALRPRGGGGQCRHPGRDLQAALERAYAAGTEGGNAKPEIWKEQAKFKELSDKLVVETGKLDAAAKTNSLDAIKAAVAGVGGTCKSCHDSFRKD